MLRISLLIAWVALIVFAELCAKPAEAAAVPMRPVVVTLTAYCLQGFTYSGVRTSHGALAGGYQFSLGQRLYIPNYGVRTVLDRGRLEPNQIDVWIASCREAIVWGRRKGVTAWILG